MVISAHTLGTLSRVIQRTISLSLLTILLANCDGNYRDVALVGQISDKNSERPIVEAEVYITWWVYDMSNTAWESKPIIDSVKSSLDGKFKLSIKKAEAYDLIVKHPDYLDHYESRTLNRSLSKTHVLLEPK